MLKKSKRIIKLMEKKIIEKLKICGRFCVENDLFFYHAGSGISFKIKGKSFDLKLSFLDKSGFIYIVVDREFEKKEKILVQGTENIKFNLPDFSEHLIDIIKCNEEQDNTLVLKELNIDGELLDFNHKFDYKIKVYGDSTIAGYGILEKADSIANIYTNDGVADFCFSALYKMNTEINIFAASGWGLSFSPYTNPKNVGIINKFDGISLTNNKKWLDKITYDLLIISLGTNDQAFIEENFNDKSLVDKFVNDYISLIRYERSVNQNLKVLMVYGTLKEEKVYYLIEKSFKEISNQFPKVFLHKFNGDNSAIANHAYVETHKKMSEELKKIVKEVLN